MTWSKLNREFLCCWRLCFPNSCSVRSGFIWTAIVPNAMRKTDLSLNPVTCTGTLNWWEGNCSGNRQSTLNWTRNKVVLGLQAFGHATIYDHISSTLQSVNWQWIVACLKSSCRSDQSFYGQVRYLYDLLALCGSMLRSHGTFRNVVTCYLSEFFLYESSGGCWFICLSVLQMSYSRYRSRSR